MSVEVKTTGELVDQLITASQRIYHLIDKVMAGEATVEEAQQVQRLNATRNELIRAIDRRLGERDIRGKVY